MEVQQGDSQLFIAKFILYKLFRLRGLRKSYLWKRISELHKLMVDIQTIHAKLDSQDGNSREH